MGQQVKARELIKFLQRQDPDALVTLAEDPEGNGFHYLFEYEEVTLQDEYGTTFIVLWPSDHIVEEL